MSGDMMSEQYSTQYRAIRAFLLIVAIFLIAAEGSGAGCGDASLGEPGCLVDGDCMSDELCIQGICRLECTDNSDCPSGDSCQSVFRSDEERVVDICEPARPQANNGNNGIGCVSDSECRRALDDQNAVCNVDRVCAVPEPVYGLLIRDVTEVDAAQEPEDGGLGADIAAVYVADEEGFPIAYGDTIVIRPANGLISPSTVDGNAPILNPEQTCVDRGFEEAATSLGGEGGHMLVRFLNDVGLAYSEPPQNWNVTIIEWGQNCPGGDVDTQDEYEVFLCVAPSFEQMDVPDCETRVTGPVSGKTVVSDLGL